MPYDNSYNNRPGEEPWGNKNPAGCSVVLAAFLVVSAIVTWGLRALAG